MSKKSLYSLMLGSTFAFVGSLISTPLADAGTRSYSHIQNASVSGVNIQSPGQSINSRSITLPYSKSTVIELPQDMMDVIVSNPDIVESVIHTSHRAVLIGKQPGQTNAYFYGHGGQELLSLDIRVERDIKGLKSLISQHANAPTVEVQAVNNNILLTGSVKNAAMANKIEKLAALWLDENTNGGGEGEIVNLMSVEGKDQVLLKVRIVEMQRSVTKQLGINLSAIGQLGDSTVSLVSNAALNPGAGLIGSNTFTNSGGGDLSSFAGSLQALERVGLIRTLAEPTLTAISGETANFLSGQLQQEFEFKPFGVSLGFTPVVLSEGRISLNISTEVSEPTTEGSFETGGVASDILGLRVRRANTVVELPAGGSLVIAGLIREETRQSADGIPGAKDIPGFGALFRNRDDLTTQSELVIMVTPYLVDPTHPDKLQTPLDGFVPSNDPESILLGKLNQVYAANGHPKIAAGSLAGPFGHVVD